MMTAREWAGEDPKGIEHLSTLSFGVYLYTSSNYLSMYLKDSSHHGFLHGSSKDLG